MADLTSSNVTTSRSYRSSSKGDKAEDVVKQVTVVVTAAGSGGAGAKLPASAFGLTSITRVGSFVKDDNSLFVVATPNYTGTEILLKNAGSNAPADYTGTFKTFVQGF
jgi:hypothetical protein